MEFHLGKMKQEFSNGRLTEDGVFIGEETLFVMDNHNHKTLAIRGIMTPKFCDAVSVDEGITRMAMLGGCPMSR